MQIASLNSANMDESQSATGLRIHLSLEVMLYMGILVLAAALRLTALGSTPLNDTQSHEALSALRRVDTTIGGGSIVAHNPLMAFVNQMVFLFADPSHGSARAATALAGCALVLAPLLWRRLIGRVMALLMSCFLCVSGVAIASARSMGGVTWTMLLVFIAGWLLLRFAETRQKSYSVLATIAIGSIIILAEPTGIVTFIGVLIGLTVAFMTSSEDSNARNVIGGSFKDWSLGEGLMGFFATVLVVGTGFFTASGGLTSVGATLYEFAQGLINRPDDVPFAFAFLVAVRYEIGFLLLAVGTLVLVFREGGFAPRFFAGWFLWSLFASIAYANPAPDAALWLVVPALGLVAGLATKMLYPISSGYWEVPAWGVPLHGVITAILLTALAINGTAMGRSMQEEATPLGIERIEYEVMHSSAKLGALNQTYPLTTMQLSIPQEEGKPQGTLTTTVQVVPLSDDYKLSFRIDDNAGQTLWGPFEYKEGTDGIIESFDFMTGVDYFLKFTTSDGVAPATTKEFMVLTYGGKKDEVSSIYKKFPTLTMLSRITTTTSPRIMPFLFVPFSISMLLIVYLLIVSLWSGRAAWRGFTLGIMICAVGMGIGSGWQASTTYAKDPRELWQLEPTSPYYSAIESTLRQLSLQAKGEENSLEILVQGEDDTALAWMLRKYEHVTFVNEVSSETTSEIIIMPPVEPETQVVNDNPNITLFADDYLGHDYIWRETWSLGDLSWTDLIAWLAVRETRLKPVTDETLMLWVRKDIYGVKELTPTE